MHWSKINILYTFMAAIIILAMGAFAVIAIVPCLLFYMVIMPFVKIRKGKKT